MDMNTLFVMATRCKFRFPFKGQISVEDLWDLSVKNLDTIFKALNAEAKQAKEESLLATKSAADAELEAKIEIIKYIVAVKQEEAKQKATAAANKEQLQHIQKHLQTLPQPYREVFQLRIFGQLQFQQIADIYGKTESWAKVTFYRAKEKLLHQLEETP